MISPQKFSKDIGKNRLKIGLSVNELILVSFVPLILNLLGVSALTGISALFGLIALLGIKNIFLSPGQVGELVGHQSHLKWEEVKIHVD